MIPPCTPYDIRQKLREENRSSAQWPVNGGIWLVAIDPFLDQPNAAFFADDAGKPTALFLTKAGTEDEVLPETPWERLF